jgi:MarR family transcriptional regulator, organic hydroperoxide resistance regulator
MTHVTPGEAGRAGRAGRNGVDLKEHLVYTSTIDVATMRDAMAKDNRLIYLISMAHLALRAHIHGLLAEQEVRLTVPQATVLFLLIEQDGRMMSELGQLIGVDNSAMTGLVDRLERAGFVRREAKRQDRRALLIRITPDGRKEAAKAARVIEGVNETIRSGRSAEQIGALTDVLEGILEQFKIR